MVKIFTILKRNTPEKLKRLFRCFKLFIHHDKESIEIDQKQLNKCKVFKNRLELIQSITNEKTVGVEVGVLYGDFSEEIINKTKINKLILIDLDTSIIKDQVRFNNKIIIKECASKNFSSNILYDWIYIDGDHSYAGVMTDINHFQKFLKSRN